MPEPVFIIYPETYAVLSERLRDKTFSPGTPEYNRTVSIVSAWEAALENHGDRVARVVVYDEDGVVTFHAYEKAWDGRVSADEED